jgi:hypothetical protein
MTSDHVRGAGRYTLACSDTAGKIATRAGAKRLVLTHFRETTPALPEDMRVDIERDFSGPFPSRRSLDERSKGAARLTTATASPIVHMTRGPRSTGPRGRSRP